MTVADPAPEPLTASFEDVPAAHDGATGHSATRRCGPRNGEVTGARRAPPNQNQRWILTVRPLSLEGVTVSLAATTDCSASAAVCTPDGRPLSNSPSATVSGPSNTPATGAPAVTGGTRVGETLTVSTAPIEDPDGLSGATFAFQWVSSDGGADADIAGATDAGYTLADSDEGRTVRVRVRVTFTDDGGHEETLTSAATAAVAPRLPPLTAAFEGVPAEHGGRGSEFRIELRFSENFPGPPGLQES